MTKISIILAAVVASAPALADESSFQNTCSNIEFAYLNNDAGITAMCLKADGTPNATQIAIQGISNQNGTLTSGSGASSFQASCGNIGFIINTAGVTLTANCRTASGSVQPSSIALLGIHNNNGTLTY